MIQDQSNSEYIPGTLVINEMKKDWGIGQIQSIINDKVVSRRNFAERSAINAPIQGGAADLIKLAMPKIYEFLINEKLLSKMLIQVHDELIFEVPQNEINTLKENIPAIMTNSHRNFLDLSVPIKVDLGLGKNWDEAN